MILLKNVKESGAAAVEKTKKPKLTGTSADLRLLPLKTAREMLKEVNLNVKNVPFLMLWE